MADPSSATTDDRPFRSFETWHWRIRLRWTRRTRKKSGHRAQTNRFLRCSPSGMNKMPWLPFVKYLANDHLYRRRQTLPLWSTKETFGAEWRVEMTNGLPWPRVPGTTSTKQRKVPPKSATRERAASKQPRFLEALYQQKLRQVILRTCFVTFAVAGSFAKTPNRETTFVSVNYLMEICFSTKNFPAPNHYGLPKSVFDKHKRIVCKCNPPTIEPPPFNQTAKVCFYICAPIIIIQLWFIYN